MISLVVPVYNVKKYINEFLDSVINQTYQDFEAVLVDDGSNDGTEAVLDEYAAKCEKLRVIHKQNEGVVRTWKRGIVEAKGDYLAFADPDDILETDMLEVLNNLMTESGADLVISGITRLENGKLVSMPADTRNLPEGLYTGDGLKEIKSSLFGNTENRNDFFFFFRWNKLFKKELLIKNLDFTDDRVKFGDDVCMCASAIYDCEKLYYSHKPLYIYRIRDDSLTTVNFNASEIDNAELLLESVFKMLKAKNGYNSFVSFNYTAYHICHLIKKIVNDNRKKSIKKQNLKKLKSCKTVHQYSLKNSKPYISRNRRLAIKLLKSPFFSFLTLIKDKL